MIKLPKKIVIYPQKLSRPDYLLCWIPPDFYKEVAIDQETEEELVSDYPNGIEIELSEDGFQEFGVQLSAPSEKLCQAYLELSAEDALPESGMIESTILEQFIKEREAGRTVEEITELHQPDTFSFEVSEGELINRLKEGPEMVGDEDSQDLFQRLSVRQVGLPRDQVGGE